MTFWKGPSARINQISEKACYIRLSRSFCVGNLMTFVPIFVPLDEKASSSSAMLAFRSFEMWV